MQLHSYRLQATIKLKEEEKKRTQSYIEQHHADKFTGGSKDPETGRTGAAISITACVIKKRATHHLSVYAAEPVAIWIALRWI